jgi:hypothetical protein
LAKPFLPSVVRRVSSLVDDDITHVREPTMAVRLRIILTGIALLAGVGVLTACSSGGTATPAGTTAAVASPQAPVPSATPGISGTASAGSSTAQVTETNPAGDIPDTQAFVDYTPTQGGYTLQVPEGWARTDSGTGNGGGSALFSDKYHSIRIDAAAAPTAPTAASGQAELTAIGSTATGFTPGKVTTEQRQAGSALLITYQADSAPNSVTGKVISQDIQRYEFWNNGKQVTLTLSAPVGSDNVDPWRTVTDSFRWAA